MPQSLAKVYVHIVFSTKNREPFLHDPALRSEMHAYLGGACKGQDSSSLIVGGVADHVHVLCRLSRTRTLAELIREIKRTSSKWIKTKGLAHFGWQNGYGAFSVSQSHIARVRRYIARQEEHHRKATFMDEFRGFLDRYEIEYDERYVWD